MNIKTGLNKRNAAISALRDLYSQAESFGFTSSEINSRFSEILNVRLHGCPVWVREYVRGYERALCDALYRTSLCHGGFLNDQFYSTHGNRSDYYERHGISAREFADDGRVYSRGHYWIKHVDAGKPKPFFTMERDQ
jgi:hypothetical protein